MAQLKSKYDNLKTSARKYYSRQRDIIYHTGGGPGENRDPKGDIYEVILQIINKKTVFGLHNRFDDDFEHQDQPEDILSINDLQENIYIEMVDDVVTDKSDTSNDNLQNDKQHEEPGCSIEAEDLPAEKAFEKPSSEVEWSKYTPKMIKQKPHKRLITGKRAKATPVTYQDYYKNKILSLQKQDDDRRRRLEIEEEYHKKKMELIAIEIDIKKNN